jgi:hypothetical protein
VNAVKLYYIATGLKNAEAHAKAREVFERPRDGQPHWQSWGITYDWTKGGKIEDDHVRPSIAIAEIEAVRLAWLLLMLVPGGRGTHVELGAALALGKTIIIVSSSGEETNGQYGFPPVFYRHPLVHHARSYEQARDIAELLWSCGQNAATMPPWTRRS